ncbi:hypothetical protein SESBI_12804 [Sesbania bispinosa]|nr:hypothetical protein SESBI_12804 [Sesbania bispinosa]
MCDTKWVISLKPLPHKGLEKGNEDSSCKICSRRLVGSDSYRYCSITCKVEAILRKPDDSDAPFISLQSLCQIKREETTEPPKRRNKRKGTPCRAPLF